MNDRNHQQPLTINNNQNTLWLFEFGVLKKSNSTLPEQCIQMETQGKNENN